MKLNHCEALIETDDYHTEIQVTVGVPEKFCNDSSREEVREEYESLLWEIFYDIICVKVYENNEMSLLVKKVLSWDAMKKGKMMFYTFEEVIKSHYANHTIIHHRLSLDDGTSIADSVDSLLTNREKKVIS